MPSRSAAKPKPLNQAIQKLITDAAECGFTFWGLAAGAGFAWAVDDRQNYHAIHSSTRGGERRSQHACGLMRFHLGGELARVYGRAQWQLLGRESGYREREITRAQLAVVGWQCDLDGPVIVHPAISTAAVEQIQLIEVDQ